MGRITLTVERTASRRGIHALTKLVVVIRRDGSVSLISAPSGERRAGGTYARGYSGVASIDLGPGDLAVHVTLVRGPRGRVKGVFAVLNDAGEEVFRAVYRRLKMRVSRGDPAYAWAVEEAARRIGLERYIKRYGWAR